MCVCVVCVCVRACVRVCVSVYLCVSVSVYFILFGKVSGFFLHSRCPADRHSNCFNVEKTSQRQSGAQNYGLVCEPADTGHSSLPKR